MEGRDHRQAALAREPHRGYPRGIEIVAFLDQLGAERPHGGILLHRIAKGHDDGGGDADPASGERDALAVIAAGGADRARDAGLLALQPVHVDQPATHLERAGRRVVLVLDPDLGAGAARQQGPGILRRGRHGGMDDGGRVFDILKGQHGATLG